MSKKLIGATVGLLFLASPLFAGAQSITPQTTATTQTTVSSSNAALIATLTALVKTLEAEIAQLIAARNAAGTAPTTVAGSSTSLTPINSPIPSGGSSGNSASSDTTTTTTSSTPITRTLSIGMSGPDVTTLQTILNSLGLLNTPPTGFFGLQTEAAVAAFQRQNGLEAVGYVGPRTRAALMAVMNGTNPQTNSTNAIPANAPAPSVTLTASANSITTGQSATLTWSSTNANSCTATGFSATGADGSTTVNPTTTTTYSVTCTGPGGWGAGTATVAVSGTTPTIATTDSDNTPAATATLTASPASISNGQSATLTWSSTNANSCTATGFTASATNGSTTVNPTTTTTYSITCTGSGGWGAGTATVSVSGGISGGSTSNPPVVTPAPTVTFTASPTSITSGQSATISWSATNATSCTGTTFTPSGTSGSLTVHPTTTTTYSISCTGAGGTTSKNASVTVGAVAPPTAPTATLTASPTSITTGNSSTLTWSSTNATSCTGNGFTTTGTSGSISVAPTATKAYSISCTGAGGTASGNATVTVSTGGTTATTAPTAMLSASPTSITSGQSSTLTWSSTNATSCTGTGFTASGTSGSKSVSPTTTSNYSLTCTGAGGSTSSGATVIVSSVGSGTTTPAPTVNFSAPLPSITSGQSSTLTWSSKNATSCTGTGFTASGTSGSITVSPSVTTNYSLSCTGPGGTVSAQTTVAVIATTAVVPTNSPPTMSTSGSVSVYSGCALPPTTYNHIWYIDPVNGKPPVYDSNGQMIAGGGMGTQAAPWNSLQALFSVVSGYKYPLLSTVPYIRTASGLVTGPLAGPVQPGDEVLLMTGNYGDIQAGAYLTPDNNSSFVTISGAPGQAAVFSSLGITASSDLFFENLTVTSSPHPGPLVNVTDQGASLPTSNIILSNLDVHNTAAPISTITPAEALADFSAPGVAMRTPNTTCVALENSHVYNVRSGVALFPLSGGVLLNNEIDYIWDDFLDFGGNNIIIAKNYMHDVDSANDGNHEDFMQAYGGPLASNILIDSNTLIRQTDPTDPDTTYAQGIDDYGNGTQYYDNVTITNNVLVSSPCSGIFWGNFSNSLIANNTVGFDQPTGVGNCAPNINVNATSTNIVVRDNISTGLDDAVVIPGANVEFDHNITLGFPGNVPLVYPNAAGTLTYIGTPGVYGNDNIVTDAPQSSMYVNFAPNSGGVLSSWDMHPAAGSPLIGAGISVGVPTVDITGAAHHSPPDIGAYTYGGPSASVGGGVTSQVASAAATSQTLSQLQLLLQQLLSELRGL